MQCSSHRISMPTIAGQHGAMIVLAGLLAAAAADDCCWFARSPKGTTFEKPRQAIGACDTKHLCFVACSAARRRVAQTYYKHRIAPKACTCDPNQVAREANFSSLAKTPISQSLRAVYAGAFLAPYKVAARVDWRGLAGEPLDAVNNGVLREASAVWRPAHPESIRVMHLSAYELGVVARHSYAEAMRRVDAVIQWQLRDLCGTTPRRWPRYNSTAAVVPFFGGVRNHGVEARALKARALKASVCGLRRDVAARVRVAVCDDDDRTAAAEALGELADVVVVPCPGRRSSGAFLPRPGHLAFLALVDAIEAFSFVDFLAFGEADLTWRLSEEAGAAAAKLFEVAPDAVLTPHRWYKRHASAAERGDAFGTQPTGQNLCSLRAGARMAAVARVPG